MLSRYNTLRNKSRITSGNLIYNEQFGLQMIKLYYVYQYRVNVILADALATNVDRASASIILIQISRIYPGLVRKGLNFVAYSRVKSDWFLDKHKYRTTPVFYSTGRLYIVLTDFWIPINTEWHQSFILLGVCILYWLIFGYP